jgi:hypothetical protein
VGQPKVDDEESLGGGTLTELGVSKERARDWLVSALAGLAEAKRRARG